MKFCSMTSWNIWILKPDYSWHEERMELIDDHGIVVPQATEFSVFAGISRWKDNLQRTIIDLSEEPEIVEEFMQALKAANMRACRVAAGCPTTYFNVGSTLDHTALPRRGLKSM